MASQLGDWFKRRFGRHEPEKSPLDGVPVVEGEIRPPWVEFPGIEPWDFFWREEGEAWKMDTWEPYYNSLSDAGQAEYLKKWQVPPDWFRTYFDPVRREFWEHADDPD